MRLRSVGPIATLIRLPHGCGLQLDDRAPDAKPDRLPIAVATFEHVVRTLRAHYLSIGIMFTDQQIGGTPSQSLGRRRC
jgi:hypothetical protein